MADYGLLVEVIAQARSANLVSDAAVSDTQLEVDDAGDFNASSDEDPDGGGGSLILNGAALAYTDITWGENEDDSDLILLADPLADAADEGDAATVAVGGLPAEDWYAVVDMGEGDNVTIPLTLAQRNQWPIGPYDPAVPVQVSEDHERLEDAPGRPPASTSGRVKFLNTDSVTVTGAGSVTLPLSFEPIAGSEHIFWNGVEQDPGEWSRSGAVVTIPDPDSLYVDGDVFRAAYAYDGAAAQIAQTPLNFVTEVAAVGGPVLWAALGDASGSTAADSSGHGRNGTYSGGPTLGQPAIAPGLPGMSVDLNGTAYVDYGAGAAWQRPASFSAMIWANPSSSPGTKQFLFGCDDLGVLDTDRIWNILDQTCGRVYVGSGDFPADGAEVTPRLTVGSPTMLFLTFDGTTVSFYKDGDLVQTATASGAMNTSTLWPLTIGASANGQVGRAAIFDGLLQHAVLWDVVATADQVDRIWRAGMGLA